MNKERIEMSQQEGCASDAAQPSAVHPANGRSGRTPAEPCLPKGGQKPAVKEPYRPAQNHPWRKFRSKHIIKQEGISTLAK